MSASELATVILLVCGRGESDRHFDCYDYYNNCVVDGGMNVAAVEKCRKTEEPGIKRIQKLKDEK
jgi:hypothetical protein